MTGGTLNAASDYALNCAYSGEANIQGGTVGTQGKGLCINNPNTVKLSGGTYATICIVSNYGAQKVPLSTILADGRAAYGPDGPITRDTVDAELTGPIIVKECEHDGVKPTSNSNGTHALKCPYCGYSEAAANCTYVFSGTTGTCAECGDSVTVAVSGTENLTYDGTGKEPGVTVTRAGTELATSDYTVAYTDNTNAGTATVTVTIGSGAYTQDFTIGKATPTITWGTTTQELPYTGNPAAITAPAVTLMGSDTFSGTITYSHAAQGSTEFKNGLPTNAGTYTIKASIAAQGNYTAAESTNTLTLTIKPTPVTLTFADQTIAYGDTPTGATADPASAKIEYSYTTGEGGEPISGWPTNAGTYTVTAKVEATGNYGGPPPPPSLSSTRPL